MPTQSLTLPSVSLIDLAVSLLLGALLATLTSWQYVRLGRTFTNRTSLSHTLPIISLTVILIITIVKSSIALSLGLVGALSIVRFRTPIREPEELAYLFIAIGIGIGLGANQAFATVGSTLFILAFASARSLVRKRATRRNLYLSVDVRDATVASDELYRQALSILGAHFAGTDLRRLDAAPGTLQAAVYVEVPDDRRLADAIAALQSGLSGVVTVTFIDQENTGVSW